MRTDGAGGGRVVMLAHTYYLRDPRVRRQAEALAERGVEIDVVCLREPADAAGRREPRMAVVNGVRIHRLPIVRRRGGGMRYAYEYLATAVLGALTLARLAFARRIDVVHVHNMPDVLVFAALVPRLSGSTVVLDVHDPMPELYASQPGGSRSWLVPVLGAAERLSCAFADRVVTVNDRMRANLAGKGVPEDKIAVVHNYPDARLFPVREPRVSWPARADRLVLLYCGTVTEHYDLHVAVRAIALVAREIPVTLRILGDGNRLAGVLALASELGVRDRVVPLGHVPLDAVTREMEAADAGISCHRAGTFGDLYFSTKIVEYLTQGLAVLSSRTETVVAYLPDDCLFYFPPGDAAALAERLRFIWDHPADVLRRSAAARGVLPRLSWQAEQHRFVDLYARLLEGGRQRRVRTLLRTREKRAR